MDLRKLLNKIAGLAEQAEAPAPTKEVVRISPEEVARVTGIPKESPRAITPNRMSVMAQQRAEEELARRKALKEATRPTPGGENQG